MLSRISVLRVTKATQRRYATQGSRPSNPWRTSGISQKSDAGSTVNADSTTRSANQPKPNAELFDKMFRRDQPAYSAKTRNSPPNSTGVDKSPSQKPSQEDSRHYVQEMKLHNANQEYAKATRVWDNMLAAGVEPNTYHYSCIFSSLRKSGDFKRARELALDYLSKDFPVSAAVDRQIFDIFNRSSDYENAKAQLEKLRENDIEIGGPTLNSHIELCSQIGEVDAAVAVALDLLSAKVALIQSTINAILRACVSNNDLRNLKRFLKAMRDSEMPEMQPDASCYTALITLLARAGRVDQMERAFEEMKSKDLEPTNITYGAMLSCYVDFNEFERARSSWNELLRLQEEKSVRIPDHAWNSMLYAHVWQGDLQGATELFAQMKQGTNVRPNTHSYTALLRLYAQNNDAHSALQIFQEMEENRVLPQLGTLNALMDCCTRSGDMDAAEEVFKHIETRNFVPSSDTYYILIKGYCDQLNVSEALRVYQAAKAAPNVTPTQATFVVLLETLLRAPESPVEPNRFFSETVKHYPRSAPALYRVMIAHYTQLGDKHKVKQLTAELEKLKSSERKSASRAAANEDFEEEEEEQVQSRSSSRVAHPRSSRAAAQEDPDEMEEVEAPVRLPASRSRAPPASVKKSAPVSTSRSRNVREEPEEEEESASPARSAAPHAISSAQSRRKVAKIVEEEAFIEQDEEEIKPQPPKRRSAAPASASKRPKGKVVADEDAEVEVKMEEEGESVPVKQPQPPKRAAATPAPSSTKRK